MLQTRYDRIVMSEGFFGELFVSLTGGAFMTALAVHLGAGPLVLALLGALPFLGQGAQLLAPLLEQRLRSRRRFVVPALAASRLLWLVPTMLAITDARGPWALSAAVASVFLLSVLAMVAQNGWLAWMADLVPSESRAHVFGRRAWAVAFAMLVAGPGGALLLDHLGGRGQIGLALGVLGAFAVVSGGLSAAALARLPDAPPHPTGERLPPTLRRLRADPRYRRVVGLFTGWSLAIGLPAPFWTLYMIDELGMSFVLITVHLIVSLAGRLLTNNAWARVIERAGSRRVLIACGFALTFNPILWLLATPDALWPIWTEACLSGVAWTGFQQAAFIQPIAVLAPADRSRGLAVFHLITGAALFAAALLGGAVLHAVDSDRSGFLALFVVSAIVRGGCGVAALRLTEPGATVRGFFVNFVGTGMLRRGGRFAAISAPAEASDGDQP